jgi:hypothetical protein
MQQFHCVQIACSRRKYGVCVAATTTAHTSSAFGDQNWTAFSKSVGHNNYHDMIIT